MKNGPVKKEGKKLHYRFISLFCVWKNVLNFRKMHIYQLPPIALWPSSWCKKRFLIKRKYQRTIQTLPYVAFVIITWKQFKHVYKALQVYISLSFFTRSKNNPHVYLNFIVCLPIIYKSKQCFHLSQNMLSTFECISINSL